MSINSYKTQILIFYILFMFVNSIIPIFSTKSIWQYADVFHFIEFFILGYLFLNAFTEHDFDKNKFLTGLLLLTLIPMIDEGLQFYFNIPGRVADVNDFIIDVIGEYSGAVFFVIIRKIRKNNG